MNRTRQVTLLVKLSDLATWIGVKEWLSENNYLDVPYDVYRPQHTDSDYLLSLCKTNPQLEALSRHAYNGVKEIHGNVEEDLYLEIARQKRIDYLKKALGELAMVSIDYTGVTTSGESAKVSGFNGGIIEIEEQEEFMKIVFINPEHIFNTLLSQHGVLDPLDSPVDVELCTEELNYRLGLVMTELWGQASFTPTNLEVTESVYVDAELLETYLKEADFEDKFLEEIVISYEERVKGGITKGLDEDIEAIGMLLGDPKLLPKVKLLAREHLEEHINKLNEALKKVS